MGRLGSGPQVVGRLESKVWVSASFQFFSLTIGRNVLRSEGNCPAGEMSGGICTRGEMSYTHIDTT